MLYMKKLTSLPIINGRVGLWATSHLHDQSLIQVFNNRMFLESAVFQNYIVHGINCGTTTFAEEKNKIK